MNTQVKEKYFAPKAFPKVLDLESIVCNSPFSGVEAIRSDYGVGGGWNTDGSSVTISGGYVYAEGGDLAAGITGGYVEAHAGEDGAGIGGGEDADGGNVTITGGEVRAYGSPNGTTIGAGEDGGSNGSLTLGDLLMVRPAFGEGWFAPVAADQRVNTCRNNTGVWIKVCNHPEHTAEDCPYHKH